jgi:hypothetical protein
MPTCIKIRRKTAHSIFQHIRHLLPVHVENANQVLAQIRVYPNVASTLASLRVHMVHHTQVAIQKALILEATQVALTLEAIREVLIINNVNTKMGIIEMFMM